MTTPGGAALNGGASDGPRVSIIIPCYRLGRFLDEAVASCLVQTFRGFEVIVVDDGSEDAKTRAVLEDYRRPGTRLLRLPHEGLARARNAGAAAANGDFLCFLDADDRLHPEYLEKALARLDADPELAFAGSWIAAFGDESWVYEPLECDLPTLLAECSVSTAAVVRRDVFSAAGGFDEGMPAQGDEDWDLWINVLTRGYRGVILPEVLFYYRRRRGSMVEACYYSETHLELVGYLFHKYIEFYRAHISAVIAHKDREIAELERNRERLERQFADELEPAVRARLCPSGETAAESGALQRDLQVARSELAALRGSRSWRVTAPLRRARSTLDGLRRHDP